MMAVVASAAKKQRWHRRGVDGGLGDGATVSRMGDGADTGTGRLGGVRLVLPMVGGPSLLPSSLLLPRCLEMGRPQVFN